MPGFRYEAIEQASGKQRRGVIEADNARQARQQLREQGMLVAGLDEIVSERAGDSFLQRQRGGVGLAQLALLTRQLSTLLDAGLTIEQALQVLIEQADQPREREVVAALRNEFGGHAVVKSGTAH